MQLAGAQNGVVSTRQLAACGIDSDSITVRVRRGQLHRIHRGVYAVGIPVLSTRGELTAAALACGDGAALARRAAAAWWEMLAWNPPAVDVIVPRGAGRRRAGIRPRFPRVDPRDVWRRDGILVTSPARTALDLAAELTPRALRRMLRQSLAEGRVSVPQLADVLDRHPRHPGAKQLRAIVTDGHVPTRSELEDRALDLLERAGVERPAVNAELRLGGRRIRPDLLWRHQRLVVELDGGAWHGNAVARQDDADRQAILEAHGFRVLRVTWRQLVDRPSQTLARLRSALLPEP